MRNRFYHYAFACITAMVFMRCGGEKANIQPEAPQTGPDTSFYKVMVDKLRMRAKPDFSGATVTLLPEGVIVKYWGDHSLKKIDVKLRDKSISDYWKLTKHGSHTGWVFGGGLEKIDQTAGMENIIIPGSRVGPVLASDTEQSIINRIGGKHVERREIMIGEGDMLEATVVFAGTDKELILLWSEEGFEQLVEIRIARSGAPWQTEMGIKVGSKLKDVEKANGNPFMMSGYQWDYAGSVLSWRDGQLSENLALVFEEPTRVHKSLVGDQGISSEDPKLRRANPKVRVIRVMF